MTEIGIAIVRPLWVLKFGVTTEDFTWIAGEWESGSSEPPQYLSGGLRDSYFIWKWLWFIIFFAKVTR